MMDALDVFRRLGAKVEEVDLGWTEDVEAERHCTGTTSCISAARPSGSRRTMPT